MVSPPAGGLSWTCSGCRRRVPSRHDECRCGLGRPATAGAGMAVFVPERAGGLRLSGGELIALVVVVVSLPFAFRALRSDQPAPPAGAGVALGPRAEPSRPPSRSVAHEPTAAVTPHALAPPTPRPSPSVHFAWDIAVTHPDFQQAPAADRRLPDDGRTARATPEPPSEVDLLRKQGRRKLEAALSRVARVGRRLVALVDSYERSCGSSGSDIPACEDKVVEIGRLAIGVALVIEEVEDAARMSWVEPGVVRELRERYGLDDNIWEEILRDVRRYR